MTPEVGLSVQDRITSWLPVPDRLTVCGLPVALSEIASAAVRDPLAAGVKDTTIVQLAPAATELPQLLFWTKSLALVPVKARLVILKVAVPVLVRVTHWDVLVTSTGWLEKARLVGERVAGPVAAVPVPERLTVWGLPLALSAMLSEAVQLPLADGVKVTLIVQLAPAATELPQLLVWAKSLGLVPASAMLVILMAAVPVLLTVMV